MGFVRKNLSADGIHKTVIGCFRNANLPKCDSDISWLDCIMSGLAVFGFKFPSLLQFEKSKMARAISKNLKKLYGINVVPSDTTMRERLDILPIEHFRRPFKKLFAHLQRGKMLERFKCLGGHYILSTDGTGQYASDKISCENCCVKHHRNGKITYYHQMLGAAIVHPNERVVIPIAPEPILKTDGSTKNDCERNASKRLLNDFRREHPHLKTIVVEDGLASNYLHLSLLDELEMKYIIGAKPGDHDYMFDWVKHAKAEELTIVGENGTLHHFRWVNNAPLNDAHHDYRVNVLEYRETRKNGKELRFSWVTSFEITTKNVYELMRIGRARWRIENETFNTLKNQGYNFEHNYGHGNKNLCSVFTMLMLLAFLIDQTQQLCCKVYQSARTAAFTFRCFYEKIRTLIQYFVWKSWQELYQMIIKPCDGLPPPA